MLTLFQPILFQLHCWYNIICFSRVRLSGISNEWLLHYNKFRIISHIIRAWKYLRFQSISCDMIPRCKRNRSTSIDLQWFLLRSRTKWFNDFRSEQPLGPNTPYIYITTEIYVKLRRFDIGARRSFSSSSSLSRVRRVSATFARVSGSATFTE